MPISQFKRQYLYVSDAQYLTSNVDLSQHYNDNNDNDNNSNNSSRSRTSRTSEKRPFIPLQLQAQQLQQLQIDERRPVSQLDRNVRLVLDELMSQQKTKHQHQRQQQPEGLTRLKELDLSSSSASSSDSGVFPNGCHSSTSSSSSSTSSLAEDSISLDMSTSSSGSTSNNLKCRCHSAQQSGSAEFNLVVNQQQQQQQQPQPQQHPDLPTEHTQFGQCALDWHKPSHDNYHQNKLVALISAGMTTGSDKKYVTDTVRTLGSLGYEVCVFIRRGVGGLKLSSNKFFSPAKWRDFEAALWSVRQQRPEARLVAVGFSFGSIELCRYLTMSGKQSLVHAALLVSCPFDPEAGGRNMRRRALNRRIDAYLAHSLGKQLYQARMSTIQGGIESTAAAAANTVASPNEPPAPPKSDEKSNETGNGNENENNERSLRVSNFNGSICDLSYLPKLKSLVDFEDNYNRIIQNYPSREAYAADCRLHEHLQNIQTPTLCLSSEDDFMAPLRLLPLQQIQANDNLCMLLTKRGGHMAFIDGLVWPKKPYFAQRIIGAYMEAIKSRLPPAMTIMNNGHTKDSAPVAMPTVRSPGMLSADSRQPSQDSAISAKSHWHLIPMQQQ